MSFVPPFVPVCAYCSATTSNVRMRRMPPPEESVYLCGDCWRDVQMATNGGRP